MKNEINEIQPLDLVPIAEDPALITIKVIKQKFVDQMTESSTVPIPDSRFPNVKIVGRVGFSWIIYRTFHDDPTNHYLGKVRFTDYVLQLIEQIVDATGGGVGNKAESAREQAVAYITRLVPELFTT